jgi:hypothetical protein
MMSEPVTRRALLVVRAGDKSMHERWLRGAESDRRDFDLHISYFGDADDPYADRPADVTLTREKGAKFAGLDACLTTIADRLPAYDYVGFPDDDLSADCATWNRFVQILLEHRPAVAQPALTLDSFWSHDILLQRRRYRLRWTNLIELMCPFFSRDALAAARPHFLENESGWGQDRLWPRMFDAEKRQLCVVDETPILHTRAVGTGPLYSYLSGKQKSTPFQELDSLIERHKIEMEPDRVYAGVTRRGAVVEGRGDQRRPLIIPRVRRRVRRMLSVNQVG